MTQLQDRTAVRARLLAGLLFNQPPIRVEATYGNDPTIRQGVMTGVDGDTFWVKAEGFGRYDAQRLHEAHEVKPILRTYEQLVTQQPDGTYSPDTALIDAILGTFATAGNADWSRVMVHMGYGGDSLMHVVLRAPSNLFNDNAPEYFEVYVWPDWTVTATNELGHEQLPDSFSHFVDTLRAAGYAVGWQQGEFIPLTAPAQPINASAPEERADA